jgi:ribonuclease HI
MTEIVIATDGAAPNNQDPSEREASVGFLVDEGDENIIEESQYLGAGEKYTNNFAEYRAIILALKAVAEEYDTGETTIRIETDSQLAVNQIQGEWNTNDETLRPLRDKVQDQLSSFEDHSIEHVSESSENRINRADSLASQVFE